MKSRWVVTTALMAAVLFTLQVSLSFLPNIELVSFLVILFTLSFGLSQTMGAVYVFAVLEGLVYGFGIWWVMYLYIWPLLALVTWLLRRFDSAALWAVVAGGFGLCFGLLCAIPYAIGGGIFAGVSYWVSGIPFDIAHCVGNAVVMLALYRPMKKVLLRLQKGRR